MYADVSAASVHELGCGNLRLTFPDFVMLAMNGGLRFLQSFIISGKAATSIQAISAPL